MQEARSKAAALHPDTFVMLSPHAPMMASKMGVSLASGYEGDLAPFGAPDVVVKADGDERLAREILERARQSEVPVATIASSGEALDLDHGSMVPLVYLMAETKRRCRLVLLTFSMHDLQEHVKFGAAVGEALLEAEQRIIYVASSDLSHRLIPGAPAGYDPRAEEFDRRVAETFAENDWRGLLSIDPELAEAAGECGYRSLAVLSGVIAAVHATGVRTQNRVYSYEGPFGVGYLVGEVQFSETAGAV